MENYEIVSTIGKGNFGSISKIKRKSDGKILVWKELDYGNMSEKEKQHIVAEVNILRELRHPNIVKYYDRIIDKKNTRIYIIMEFCEGGDMGALVKRCKKSKEYIAEDVIWKIFTQLILALHECHSYKEGKILHRDLKLSNVFMDLENNVKLGDFGLSRVLTKSSEFAISHVGTPYYMSPEQIEELEYNEKSDIWSLGCLLFEIAALIPPFEASNHLSLANKIKNGKFERIPLRYSEELQRVIQWMITVDQNKRPSIEDLINLPQVSLRLRERRLKDNLNKMKLYEETLKTRENEINKKEKELQEFELSLKEKEKKLMDFEKYLKEKDKKASIEEKLFKNENIIEKEVKPSKTTPTYLFNEEMYYSNRQTHEHLEKNDPFFSNYMSPLNNKYFNTNVNQTPKEKHVRNVIDCSEEMLEKDDKSQVKAKQMNSKIMQNENRLENNSGLSNKNMVKSNLKSATFQSKLSNNTKIKNEISTNTMQTKKQFK